MKIDPVSNRARSHPVLKERTLCLHEVFVQDIRARCYFNSCWIASLYVRVLLFFKVFPTRLNGDRY